MRKLRLPENQIDFSSNDYLGFAADEDLHQKLILSLKNHSAKNGSTGSRLLTGNSALAEELEIKIAEFFKTESALLFNSGYDANIGLLSSLPQRGDTIITDALVHASIIDGVRLSHANRFIFKHNDLNNLEEKLSRATGICYVIVESVYSMDGDEAPLAELILRTKKHHAQLIVDEAHAVGISKRGLCVDAGLENDVFARIVTFGKAFGAHGAVVLGGTILRDYLINFARSFIYSTAQSPHSLLAIKGALKKLDTADAKIEKLLKNRAFFQAKSAGLKNLQITNSAIQQIIIPGNEQVRSASKYLAEKGFDVRPIVSPTVPAGTERLRICLHSFNTEDEISGLVELLMAYGL